MRDLLLDALARLPDLVLAFTQDDNALEWDYADRTPLRLQLPILTAEHLPERIAAALGEHELPTPLLAAIAAHAKGAAGEAAFVLADLTARGLLREGDDGRWRLQPDGDDDARLEELDRLLGPGLLAPLDARLALVRGRIGSTAADDLAGFLHHASLCGRNIPFGPIADVLGLDDPRRDALAGELFYWVDASHARSIRRQLTRPPRGGADAARGGVEDPASGAAGGASGHRPRLVPHVWGLQPAGPARRGRAAAPRGTGHLPRRAPCRAPVDRRGGGGVGGSAAGGGFSAVVWMERSGIRALSQPLAFPIQTPPFPDAAGAPSGLRGHRGGCLPGLRGVGAGRERTR